MLHLHIDIKAFRVLLLLKLTKNGVKMSKTRSDFLEEARLRDRVINITKDLQSGKIVYVGDSDYTMTPEDLDALKKDLASKGLEIAPICHCDSSIGMPDGKTQIGVRSIQKAAAPKMHLQNN